MWLNDYNEPDGYSKYYFNSDRFDLWWRDAYFAWRCYSYRDRSLHKPYFKYCRMWFNYHNELNSYSKYYFDSGYFDLWWSYAYFTWWSNCYNFWNVCFTCCKCSRMWLNDHNEPDGYSKYDFNTNCFHLWWSDSYFAWWSFCYHFRNVCFSYYECCGMWFNDHNELNGDFKYNFNSDCFDLWWSDSYFAWWSNCYHFRNLCFSHYKCSRMWFNDHNEFNSYSKYNIDSNYFNL